MGLTLARSDIREGIKLYQGQQYEAAIRKWRRCLHRIREKSQRFVTLDYLAKANGHLSRHRDMLAYAGMQIEIANEADNPVMRVEAYLNLATSNERLCEYHKAVSYSRLCLQSKPQDIRTYGDIYLVQGKAYFGLSNFSKALEMLEYAIRIAKKHLDLELEVQVHTALGELFLDLKDYDKGMKFHLKAMESAKGLPDPHLAAKYQRVTFANLGLVYQRQGRADQALECSEAALRSALAESDKPVQAKCLSCTAHIYRAKKDFQKAREYYESAGRLLVDVGDRLGQVGVLEGMAKTTGLMRDAQHQHEQDVCECTALEYNQKALDIATAIGNKIQQLRCNRRMEQLYSCLGDAVLSEVHSERCEVLEKEVDLRCCLCDLQVGEVPDSLDLFSCFHLAHGRCVEQLPNQSSSAPKTSPNCPKCRQKQQHLQQSPVEAEVLQLNNCHPPEHQLSAGDDTAGDPSAPTDWNPLSTTEVIADMAARPPDNTYGNNIRTS